MNHRCNRVFLASLVGFLFLVPTFISYAVAEETLEDLKELEKQIQSTVSKVMPAVVSVTDGQGFGSGVIVSADGLVLTAGHVMASRFKDNYEVIFPDGTRVKAEPLGKNETVDAGMVRIVTPGPYPYAKIAQSDPLEGDWVITLGHSGGYDLGRKPPVRTGRVLRRKGHQVISDAVLVGGDSGGPLFNIDGQVIGIHSSIGDSIAENRHVTINTFRKHWTRMASGEVWGELPDLSKSKRKEKRASIGVVVDRTADNALVKNVHEDSPAYNAGIRIGDVITRFDNVPISSAKELIDLVKTCKPGKGFSIEILRNGLYFNVYLVTSSQFVSGQQLSREVREKFEAMLDGLDVDLRAKFQTALDNNTPIVELTPRQFRKFRDSPVNQFDLNDVDPDDLDGNIELKFELPSLRNRPVQRFERQSRSLRRNLRGSVRTMAESVVKITDGRDQLALGTVIRSDGMVLTKASEVAGKDRLYAQLAGNKVYSATVLSRDKKNDVALLKVEADNLKPITWSNVQPRSGSFVVTSNPEREVVSLGSYSVVSRSTVGESQGFLGVAPRTVSQGVKIEEAVEFDTAAYAAGLRRGDIITAIDQVAVNETFQLVDEIRKRQAGDEIKVQFIRNGERRSTTAKLAGRSLTAERAAQFKKKSRLGAVPSKRKSEFPVVFQHDSPLFPEQCGGPICDLEGNVLGLNIARESRAASYAIPSNHLQTVVDELLRYDIPARKNQSR